MPDALDHLRKAALALDEAVETVACRGTALEQSAFAVGKKSFLFAQRKGDQLIARLKLEASLPAASKAGAGVEVGKAGWVTLRLPLAEKPSAAIAKWIRESHALAAPAQRKR